MSIATCWPPDGQGIQRLTEVDKQLRQVPGVRDVLSLAEVNRALNYAHPLQSLVQSEEQRAAIVDPDSRLAAAYRDMFEGYTHNAAGDIAALACMLEPEQQAAVPRRETIDQIRQVLEQQPQGMIAGEPVMVIEGFATWIATVNDWAGPPRRCWRSPSCSVSAACAGC